MKAATLTAISWEYDRKADVLYAALSTLPEGDEGADVTASDVGIYRDLSGSPSRLVVMTPSALRDESGILIDDDPPFYLELPPGAERKR